MRAFFQPVYPDAPFLAYVEPLIPVTVRKHRDGTAEVIANKNSGLVEVRRAYDADGTRLGTIINITDIWRPIVVVPNFGPACPDDWTHETAVEEARTLFINVFCDKETYQCTSF